MEKEHLTLEKMAETYRKHDANDAREFTAINDKLDKREQMALEHGKHLKDINEAIKEIKDTIADVILPHITATSPILQEFQDKQETERALVRISGKIKKYGTIAVFIFTVLAALKGIISYFK